MSQFRRSDDFKLPICVVMKISIKRKMLQAQNQLNGHILDVYQAKDIAVETIVEPALDYPLTVWDPHKQTSIKSLEQVQQGAVHFVSRATGYKPFSTEHEIYQVHNNSCWHFNIY